MPEIKIDPFVELGVTGLKRTGGVVRDEFIQQLQGQQGARLYREMADNDPVVGALVFAIERLILQIDWRVNPYEEGNSADQEAADFVEECLYDMSSSWEDTVSNILSMLVYGYAFTEIVYKRRGGPQQTDSKRKSAYSDGKIGWRKMSLRAQETTYDWLIDEKGGIQGLRQQDPNGVSVGLLTIPIEKGLLFRTSTARNNPEGRSLLRNAYRPWRFKKTIEEIEAVGIERDLAGLPVALVPPSMLSQNATDNEAAARTAIETLVRGIKRNENEGILFPLMYDENGREMYKLTLLTTGGARQFDTDKIVGRYDQRIAMTVLADFILLGHENVGSFSLGASKIDLFTTAISQIAQSIADVMNQYAIPRLMKLNGMDVSRQPELAFGELNHVDLGLLGDFIAKTAGTGALVIDEALDEHLRQVSGLPPRSEGEGALPVPKVQKPVPESEPEIEQDIPDDTEG